MTALLIGDEIVMADEIAAGPTLVLTPGAAGPVHRGSSDSLPPPPPPLHQPQPHRPHASHDFLASGSFDSPSPTTPSSRSVAGSPRGSPGAGAVGAARPSGGGGSPGQSPTRNPVGQHQSNRSGRWNSNTLAGPSGSPPRTGGVHTPHASIFDGSDAALQIAVPVSATPVPAAIPAPTHPNHTSIDFSAANAVPLLAKANAHNVRASLAVVRTRKILLRWLTKSALRVSFSRAPSTSSFGYLALKTDAYRPFYLAHRTPVSSNTVLFRFALPSSLQRVGLPVGKHMLLRCLDSEGKVVSRPYTPVSADEDLGHFDLLVKLYPTGKMVRPLFTRTGGVGH